MTGRWLFVTFRSEHHFRNGVNEVAEGHGGKANLNPVVINPRPNLPPHAIPVGAPSWITPELVADTIETWQPYYTQDLTADDAVEILMGVGNLFKVLKKS